MPRYPLRRGSMIATHPYTRILRVDDRCSPWCWRCQPAETRRSARIARRAHENSPREAARARSGWRGGAPRRRPACRFGCRSLATPPTTRSCCRRCARTGTCASSPSAGGSSGAPRSTGSAARRSCARASTSSWPSSCWRRSATRRAAEATSRRCWRGTLRRRRCSRARRSCCDEPPPESVDPRIAALALAHLPTVHALFIRSVRALLRLRAAATGAAWERCPEWKMLPRLPEDRS